MGGWAFRQVHGLRELELERGREEEAHGLSVEVRKTEDGDAVWFAVVSVRRPEGDIGVVVDDHLVVHQIFYQNCRNQLRLVQLHKQLVFSLETPVS